MRWALLLVALVVGVVACSAFSPDVGPLKEKHEGCGADEANEYGADAAYAGGAGENDGGCGSDEDDGGDDGASEDGDDDADDVRDAGDARDG